MAGAGIPIKVKEPETVMREDVSVHLSASRFFAVVLQMVSTLNIRHKLEWKIA